MKRLDKDTVFSWGKSPVPFRNRIRSCTFKEGTNMRKHSIFFFFMMVFFAFPPCKSILALEVTVSPQEVIPGDAFVIKVTGTKALKLPPVSFMGNKFYFSRCGKGCLCAVGAVGMNAKPGDYTLKLKIGKKRKCMKIVVNPVDFPTIEF